MSKKNSQHKNFHAAINHACADTPHIMVLLSNNQIPITLREYETISQMICKVSGEV